MVVVEERDSARNMGATAGFGGNIQQFSVITRTVNAVDLFCGAGGSSSGLLKAAKALGLDVDLLAVNCWQIAINTHSLNHPGVRHICQTLETVKPREVVPGGHLDLLLASPECTHHSCARGGKPINDQSRSTAWRVIEWLDALNIDHVIIENVPEFRNWGPLDTKERPIQSKRGSIYRRFLSVIRAMGYTVEDRILNAADYGDATTRKRLFIQARKGRGKIVWPDPTHIKPAEPRLGFLEDVKPWRAAREIIDWSLVGESIYNRKRPLSPNTIRRIMAGLQKYGGLPFIAPVNHGREDRRTHSLEDPIPTVTTFDAMGFAQPYIVVLRNNSDAASVDAPVPTLCAGGNHVGVAQPFLVKSYLGSDAASLDSPLPTITAAVEHFGLAEPVLINMKGQSVGRDLHQPVPTVTDHAPHLYLADPYVVSYHGNHSERVDGDGRVTSVDEPLRTLDTSNRYGLARPFLVKYHGSDAGAHSVDEPLDTITTRDRYALVNPELVSTVDGSVVGWLDIRFRMLQPHELAAAMSFPEGYQFTGTREAKVRQIGNAVPVRLAAALCGAALGQAKRMEARS